MRGLETTSLFCSDCGQEADDARGWRCAVCGGPLDLPTWSVAGATALPALAGLQRFRDWIPAGEPVSLGEAITPLVRLDWPRGSSCLTGFKIEGALPTGSFKDRGSAFLVGRLRSAGITGMTVDSSGNAGASLAAYCAVAGIAARVFVPASASGAKLAQIRAYGAEVVPVEGSRADVTTAAVASATEEYPYASHIWSPYFILGTQTFAFELFAQLDGAAPDAIVCPLGAGTLLLGCYLGFQSLVAAGLCDRVPALFGVQAERCAPLARAWEGEEAGEGACAGSIAEGIMIASPPRASSVLAAVRTSGGAVLSVAEEAIAAATLELGRRGIYAEPTAAVPAAALGFVREAVGPDADVVVAVTATGLKAGALVEKLLSRELPS